MKNQIAVLGVLVSILIMSFIKPLADTYTIDSSKSKLKWTGYHLAKSYEHHGYVQLKSGSINIENGKLSSGNLVIDMSSISNEDLTKEKDNKKLVKHLKSDDFFGVEKHPEAKLNIKKAVNTSGKNYDVTADLTIKGIMKEIKFKAEVSKLESGEYMAKAKLRIQRTDYKVMYGWSVENAMLDEEFEMDVTIVAKN